MARLTYLDHAATTPLDERVLEAMLPYLRERWGNPSSLYSHGRVARRALDESRDTVAQVLSCRPSEVLFTSGGTESDNLAIKGVAFARRQDGDHIVTTKIEHHAALRTCEWLERKAGFRVTYVGVDKDGVVDLEELERVVRPGTILVSAMLANNEVGTIQPIAEAVKIARRHGATVHTDAVQAAGALELDPNALGVDLLSLSGHKIYGPKGVGALYVRRRPRVRLSPLFSGGGQERGLRSGTLPAPLIVGLGEACRLAQAEMADEAKRLADLRDAFLDRLRADLPGIVVNGSTAARIPGNLNLTFPAAAATDLMARVPDLCVSTGSACSSATIEPSYVLRAIGLSEEAAGRSLRIGLGRFTSPADIEYAAAALAAAHSGCLADA
jgi:cysteine desulfurase